ncbi:MAG: hypothetical protein J6W06_09565 [Bacteroidales bacterium]|nr:hypothetical protein [Bacteroidales bacterium]
MRKIAVYFIVLTLLAALVSCGNAVQYKQVSEDFSNVESTADKSHIDSILNQLPKYSEICKNIRINKIKFDKDLLLDVHTANLYQNSKETAMAMGMFVADLGYARYFERVQVCTDILEATKQMAEKLAVDNNIFSEYVPKIEENINDEQVIFATIDSLLNTNAIVPTEAEKYGITAMFVCGFWLETTYLGLAQETDTNEANASSMESHFRVLHSINELLSQLSDTDAIESIKTDFASLENDGTGSEKIHENIIAIRNRFVKII